MNRYKHLVSLLAFLLFFGLTNASSQNLPDRTFLLIAPFKPHTHHHNLLKGFQQIIIDEVGRITKEPITNRELIDQFLREQGTGKEPFTVYHTDVPDLTEHLNADKVLLMDFKEKHGKVTVKINFMEGNTGTTIRKEEAKGILGAFPKLEKNVLDDILSVLGFLGDAQIQKRAAEGPKCLLGGAAIFGKGLDFLDKGSLENAARYFHRAINLDPTIESVYRQLEQVFKKAEEELFEPADIGMVYLQGGDINKARSYFAEALDQNKSDIKGLIGMGQIFLKENELEKASKNLCLVLNIKDEQGVFFDLEPGQYYLLIHFKNKKFSKKIKIPSIDTYEFSINLGGRV